MGRLSSDEILNDKQTRDTDSIISLSLTHKALSDVSCLRDFKHLDRLDLSFNSLTSLEDLRECVNLKWLSVVQNKLQSLKGIERLTKLTVLNAGKNKIRSLDEVQKLVNLRALIMNDNEIVSICKLDDLKFLNTIVVSRNPLRKLSLNKLKLMSKLSLSNCQLESIDLSIKVCSELKELRLAHNDIKMLPDELAHNTKLQNLDLGNNLISRLSDLKVLSSLQRLKNLNLHGNPIAENDELVKKIRKLVPSIQIFNSKPMEKYSKNEKDDKVMESEKRYKERDNAKKKHSSMDMKLRKSVEVGGAYLEDSEHSYCYEESKASKEAASSGGDRSNEKRKKEKSKKMDECEDGKKKKVKTGAAAGGKKGSKDIDDGDTPFWELVAASNVTAVVDDLKCGRDLDSLSSLVIDKLKHKNKKRMRSKVAAAVILSPQATQVGAGGPSAWDDE
ncbi:hypothetical protein V2J09_006276 [Rumex salicifolius]